jgi:hypothetical protein
MSTRPTTDPNDEANRKNRAERQATAICVSVMHALGRPVDFFRVSVVPLWENRYRVNVQTGSDVPSLRIAHSFFVTADENGNVLESIPPIMRLY